MLQRLATVAAGMTEAVTSVNRSQWLARLRLVEELAASSLISSRAAGFYPAFCCIGEVQE